MAIDTQSQAPSPGNARSPGAVTADVLDSLGSAVLVVDRGQSVLYRNSTGSEWLPDGRDLHAVWADARFPESFEGWAAVLQRVIDNGEKVTLKCASRRSTASSPVVLTMQCIPLRGQARQTSVDAAVILIEEEAEQAAIEQRLEVSKRLASLGKLATRVAHELNNPLDGILRYINLAMRITEDTPDSKLKTYLLESRTGLMRMVQIIGDLLEFSRVTDGEFDEMNVNEVVEQAIKSTASAADTNQVVVAADFRSEGMPCVYGSRLYQVCCNLIRNAIDAMPDGGRLSITTVMADGNVLIEVADTGIGLPEHPEKVFEPFFTTKEPGKGTGLGLAICKDFIEDMNGIIDAAPGEDGGAVLTVRIPVDSFHRPSRLTAPAQHGESPARAAGR